MSDNSRNYSKYSMGYEEYTKLKKLEDMKKKIGEIKNSPMTKSAVKFIIKAACIASVVVIATSTVQKKQEEKAQRQKKIQEFLMSRAENKALDLEKTSDAVSVIQSYSPHIVDYLADSLKELGISVNDNNEMTNDKFIQAYIDTMDYKYENRAEDTKNYSTFLKKAVEMTVKKQIFGMVSQNEEFVNNGYVPKSYHDIEFVSSDSFKDNASIGLKLEGELGPYTMTISDSVVGTSTKMPNNLLELICNINEKNSIVDKDGLARFVSDFEKWAVDTQNYSMDKNNRIAVKGYLDANRIVNSAHREIRSGYRETIYNKLWEEYNLGKGFDEI